METVYRPEMEQTAPIDCRGIAEQSTFHAVQSSVLQYASQEDTAQGVQEHRHRRLHDHCIGLNHYREKTFSFVGGVGCPELAV